MARKRMSAYWRRYLHGARRGTEAHNFTVVPPRCLRIGDDSCMALAGALQHNFTLRSFTTILGGGSGSGSGFGSSSGHCFTVANAIQTNASLQSLSHVTGSGGDSSDNEITEQCNSDGRKGESSVPRCSIVKKPPFFHNLKQSMEVEWWEDALGTPV